MLRPLIVRILPVVLCSSGVALADGPVVSAPVVTGPIKITAKAPDPSHGYPFNPTYLDLAAKGYVEEEFFIEGSANQYTTSADANATWIDGGHPYKTRIVVRRPIAPRTFNGTAIVEWTNVTGSRDLEMDWFQSADHFVRSGYAWIGVSAQRVGVDALKAWSPERYAPLDVTEGGKIKNDALSYDIMTGVALLLRDSKAKLLGRLEVKRIIATGHSQSAGRLAIYANSVHPLKPVYDGIVLHGGGGKIRTDIDVKVWKLLSETDIRGGPAARQPDTDKFRTWEVAGTSHVDAQSSIHFTELGKLNAGLPPGAPATGTCDKPPFSQVPFHYVFNAAFDHFVTWIQKGTPPPTAPPIEFNSATPPAIARDEMGNALGGIRLSQHAVPTAVNTGQNGGTAFCRLYGSHVDFDPAKKETLYPTHKAYVAAVRKVTEANLKAGYLVKADADATIAAAEQSSIGGK